MRDTEGMHVDDGALLALIDGEATTEGAPREHVDSCEVCTSRLEELRFADRRVGEALATLDTGAPWSEMPETLREARRDAVTPIAAARGRSAAGRGRIAAAAAGLILFLAAGAYAVPGSPVRDFVDAMGAFLAGDVGPADPGPSSVAVEPVDGAVRVVIVATTGDLRITVRASETDRAHVSARDAAFGVEAGEIRVRDAAGDVTVELPADARGTVVVDGVEVARVSGGTVVRLPAADDGPAEIVVETAG